MRRRSRSDIFETRDTRTAQGIEVARDHVDPVSCRYQMADLTSVRELAGSRQNLADVREASAARIAEVEREEREKIAAAERDDARAYSATIDAGWTPRRAAQDRLCGGGAEAQASDAHGAQGGVKRGRDDAAGRYHHGRR